MAAAEAAAPDAADAEAGQKAAPECAPEPAPGCDPAEPEAEEGAPAAAPAPEAPPAEQAPAAPSAEASAAPADPPAPPVLPTETQEPPADAAVEIHPSEGTERATNPDGTALDNEMLDVIVEAEDEDDKRYQWQCRVSTRARLREIARGWALAFGVDDPSAVGLEDTDGEPMDTSRTPLELRWSSLTQPITVCAVPLIERYAEPQAHQNSRLAPASNGAGNGALTDAKQRKRGNTRSGAGSSAQAKEGSGSAAAAPAAEATDAEQKRRRKGGNSKPAVPASPATASTPAPKPQSGPCPQGDDPIEFVKPNPKRPNTQAHDRYEKYINAKTVNEALRTGAVKPDIEHDFKRGFLRRK